MLWSVYPHNPGPAIEPGQCAPLAVFLGGGSLDDALAQFAGEPLTFEARGTDVTPDEFRRRAVEELAAPMGTFVVRSLNGQKRIDSALV